MYQMPQLLMPMRMKAVWTFSVVVRDVERRVRASGNRA